MKKFTEQQSKTIRCMALVCEDYVRYVSPNTVSKVLNKSGLRIPFSILDGFFKRLEEEGGYEDYEKEIINQFGKHYKYELIEKRNSIWIKKEW